MEGDGKGGKIKMILWIGWEEERKVREREGGRGKVGWRQVRGGRIYNRPRCRNNYSNNLHPYNKTFQTY